MIWVVLAWMLERVALKIGAFSYGVVYNGVGAIDPTFSRESKAPMAYRVLVPWLVRLAERAGVPRERRLTWLYEPLKIVLTGLALASVSRALGRGAALFVAAALPATFLYDYWDWTGEMGGLALALSGSWPLAFAGGLWAALSRPETALLVPVTYFLRTWDLWGVLVITLETLATLLFVRGWVGDRPLYCDRWMWRVNLQDLRTIMANRPVYLGEMSMSVGITVLTLAAACTGRAGWTVIVPILLLAAGWTMARAAETRVFASCLLWIPFLFLWR